jgi:hypothetical protein
MNDLEQYERLVQLVDPTKSSEAPAGLYFWLRSQPDRSGMAVWSDCPRADWMLWIARQMKVSDTLIRKAEEFMRARLDERKYIDGEDFAPLSTAAEAVRNKINWADVVYGTGSDSGAVSSAWT